MNNISIGLSRSVRASVIRKGTYGVFLDRLNQVASHVRSIVVLSPWISVFRDSPRALPALATLINQRRIPAYVFTRPPENHDHLAAGEILAGCPTVELVYNAYLHAKIYVCNAPPRFGFAILGSANMTAKSEELYEIGLLVQGVGGGEAVVKELASFGLDYIRTRPESRVAKKLDTRRMHHAI